MSNTVNNNKEYYNDVLITLKRTYGKDDLVRSLVGNDK